MPDELHKGPKSMLVAVCTCSDNRSASVLGAILLSTRPQCFLKRYWVDRGKVFIGMKKREVKIGAKCVPVAAIERAALNARVDQITFTPE